MSLKQERTEDLVHLGLNNCLNYDLRGMLYDPGILPALLTSSTFLTSMSRMLFSAKPCLTSEKSILIEVRMKGTKICLRIWSIQARKKIETKFNEGESLYNRRVSWSSGFDGLRFPAAESFGSRLWTATMTTTTLTTATMMTMLTTPARNEQPWIRTAREKRDCFDTEGWPVKRVRLFNFCIARERSP